MEASLVLWAISHWSGIDPRLPQKIWARPGELAKQPGKGLALPGSAAWMVTACRSLWSGFSNKVDLGHLQQLDRDNVIRFLQGLMVIQHVDAYDLEGIRGERIDFQQYLNMKGYDRLVAAINHWAAVDPGLAKHIWTEPGYMDMEVLDRDEVGCYSTCIWFAQVCQSLWNGPGPEVDLSKIHSHDSTNYRRLIQGIMILHGIQPAELIENIDTVRAQRSDEDRHQKARELSGRFPLERPTLDPALAGYEHASRRIKKMLGIQDEADFESAETIY